MAESLTHLALKEAPADPALAGLLERLEERYGQAMDAVLLYGSYLRGDSAAIPDLYVLLSQYPATPRLERWLGGLLPPNVYFLVHRDRQAKVSVLRTRQLLNAVTVDLHPYFWARFAQPCRLLYCRNTEIRSCLAHIVGLSADRLLAAMGTPPALQESAAYWTALLKRTYAAELRAERAGKYRDIYQANAAYYDALFAAAPPAPDRPLRWRVRIWIGKALSAARLLKSAITFEDPVGYMLWKVERHSGVRLEATDRQRRYPFLFAWPLVWRLYRAGAFR